MLVSKSETPLTAEMYNINAFPGIPILQEMISEKKKKRNKVNETIIHCRLDTKVLFRHS